MFVFMNESHAGFFGQSGFVEHPVEDIASPVVPVAVLGQVITEDADVAGLEDFAQLNGLLKSFQVRLERLVDLHLANRGADSTESEAMFLQQRLELADLQIGQV